MKTLFGVGLLLLAAFPLMAVEVGNTYEQVILERGLPPGKLGAGGFVILAYPNMTIRLMNNRVIKISGPPPRISVVPAPKPKPKPKPVPAWVSDLDDAIAQARDKNRRLLLFFTSADGGSRSQQFESEILSTPEFVDYAKENLVVLKMDFPKSSSSLSGDDDKSPSTPAPSATTPSVPATKPGKDPKGNEYPLVYVLDSDGRPVGSLGYPDGGPNAFIDAIKKL